MIRCGMKLRLKILATESQRRCAEEYIWRCLACYYSCSALRIGRERIARHIVDLHAMVKPNASFQEGKNLKRHPKDMRDILQA
jgi:hypothetical protein